MPLEALFAHARRDPARVALVHNGDAWTFAAFARAIAQARAHLAGAGLRPGGLAVIAIDSLLDAWAASFALRSLGFTTVAIDRHMDLPALGLGEVSGVVVVEGLRHEAAESFARALGRTPVRLPATRLSALAEGAVPAMPAAGTALAGHVVLTSGTTGAYKKVLREAGADLERVGALADVYGFTESSVVCTGSLPLWTAGGYRWPRAAWTRGATVAVENSLQHYRPFRQLAVTHAFATPAMLAELLEAPEGTIRRNDAMRLIVTAGALPKALADRARARLTRDLYTAYASTEASIVTMTRIDGDEDLLWHRPLDPGAIQVVDEAGRELPAGALGHVRVRASRGVEGYLGDEAATREFFHDGWFHPGDLGVRREDGRLCLQGRATDVINLLGNKIATGPLERALQDGLGVTGACLFAAPGGPDGDEVHVAIESRKPVAREALADIARTSLSVFPRVHFHVVEALPRNTMGKIKRLELRQTLLAGAAAGRPGDGAS